MTSKPVFTISLDFELYWGVRDKRTAEEYKENLLGVDKAISKMLELFKINDIHATWATVGFLFFKDVADIKDNLPASQPQYINSNLSPYTDLEELKEVDRNLLFANKLISEISTCGGQEIGTHTYSHYYCLENGQSAKEFEHDLQAAKNIASRNKIELKSLVFPRNQWNEDYLSILNKMGIKSYRGNESGWMYKASKGKGENKFKRAFRLLDAYINVSGHNTYDLLECKTIEPFNFQSSRFLRSYSRKLSALDWLKLARIKDSMTYAAKNNEVFHLWWHPHNFGVNTDKNMHLLTVIIKHFSYLQKKYGMVSMNMGEMGCE